MQLLREELGQAVVKVAATDLLVRCVSGVICLGRVTGVMTAATAMTAVTQSQVFQNMLIGQLGWLLQTPIGQSSSDRPGILKARNVMTAVTAELDNRPSSHVHQLGGRTERLSVFNNQFQVGALQSAAARLRNPRFEELPGLFHIVRPLEVFQRQGIQLLDLLTGQPATVAECAFGGLPAILAVRNQVSHDIRRRIADSGNLPIHILVGDGLQEEIRHDRAGMVA